MIKFLFIIFMFLIIFPYTSSCTIFAQLQNNSSSPTVSNSVGTFSIDKDEYDVSFTKGNFVKTFGSVNKPHDGGRVDIVITLPDKSIQGYLIFINATNAYYQNQYALDVNSEKGTYHVLASYDGDIIGTLDFTVKQVLLKQTPITNTTTVSRNQTNEKTFTKNTINYIDTRLSLDYKESGNKGYVSVYTTLNTNSGNLQNSVISIFVDGQFKTHVYTDTWSSDILVGFGSHSIEAVYPQTSDPKNNSTIYKNSDIIKTIVIQQPVNNSITNNPSIQSSQSTLNVGNIAVIDTKFGEIKFKLLENIAPKTTSNFVKLATSGFYNGTIFHRIVPGFVIQAGDPNTIKGPRSSWGLGDAGYTIPPEFSTNTQFSKYMVGMARGSDVNSGSSQFFITLGDAPWLNDQYTLFGQVISGQNVVDKIASLPIDSANNQPVDANAARIDNISIQSTSNLQPTQVPSPTVSNTPPPQQKPSPTVTPAPNTVTNAPPISNTSGTLNYTYVVLAIVAVIVSAIVLILIRKRKSKVTPKIKSDDTQFYGCPVCGGDTLTKKGKQFCNKCNQYL